ncbi:MAG: MoxR-like ATPase [Gaiellaceae bacterium]|jgi:MoxR-like ATPase|nr:MoxR-like ATPase [Gaiellaceae bacterium]
MTIANVQQACDELLGEVERAIIGKRETLELVLLGFLADGHVLLEDVPGLAKTLMARSFAQTIGLRFARVQFTPDLMPADITGSSILDQRSSQFEFRRGPIFSNLLLADEINRSPAKTQAALLEAMQERQVTIDGTSYPLEPPFLVVATQNPIEYEGTYPLPEAQLDRFILRTSVGYPSREDEWTILENRLQRRSDEVDLKQVLDPGGLLELQRAVETVHVAESAGLYMIDIVEATRQSTSVSVGASPRGSLALMKLSRARAALQGRDFVTPEDVKAVAVPALSHRLTLRPELWVQRVTPADIVQECLASTPTPAAEDALAST